MRGIGVERRLDLLGGQAVADSQTKQVDVFFSAGAENMSAKNSASLELHENLEAGAGFRHAPGGIPAGGVGRVEVETEPLLAGRFLRKAAGSERRQAEDRTGNAAIVRPFPIALQQISGDDAALVARHWSERRPRSGGISRGIHAFIGRALQK